MIMKVPYLRLVDNELKSSKDMFMLFTRYRY